MGIQVGNCRDAAVNRSELVVGARPGLYESERGSLAILPEKNVTNRSGREVRAAVTQVLIMDVDSNRTVLKDIDSLKGVYTFKCRLDEVRLLCPDYDDRDL